MIVAPEHRGRGLGTWLVETVLSHPAIAEVRQVVLATADAHGLYARLGFEPLPAERYMVLRRPRSSRSLDPTGAPPGS